MNISTDDETRKSKNDVQDSSRTGPLRVAALLTAHNRRDLTLECLESLHRQVGHSAHVDTYLVDDGSSDGTARAVQQSFPQVRLLRGDGTLFWGGGMRLAFATAFRDAFTHFLWVNDDTRLEPDALARLLTTERRNTTAGRKPAIIVGTTRHPATGELTYGGQRRPSRVRPLHFELVAPSDSTPLPADTMNGNFVLIPRAVAEAIGNISDVYIQQMGDLDYGLRANAAGFDIWIAPGTIGWCADHPRRPRRDEALISSLKQLWSTKELEPRAWLRFSRRWAGPLWPLYWVSPYARRTAEVLTEQLRRRALADGA